MLIFLSPFCVLRLTVDFPNRMFSETARCLLFWSTHIPEAFFLLSWMIHVILNLNTLVFPGIKGLLTGQIASFFLVQHLVFLYRAPGRHWSVEAYHAPRGNTRAWALEETLFRVCEFKGLHKRCAITHICADALTACFPALCSVCFLPVFLGDYAVFTETPRRWWFDQVQLFSFQMLCVAFCCVVPTNLPQAAAEKCTHCFKACSLLLVWTRCLQLRRVRPRSSFLTNFALSLNSPWHKRCRYKPASADNATDRNASSIPNKQDAQPWGEQEPQFIQGL